MGRNIAASVRDRLFNLTQKRGGNFQKVLVLYALERLLYRLGKSQYADRFLLKGALLFSVWYTTPHRVTRDADFLGFGESDKDTITQIFREIASLPCDDGVLFKHAEIQVEPIRKLADYGGLTVLIPAVINGARCMTKVDIGFGDVVTPPAERITYPVFLSDMPAPQIRAYSVYTVIAEKLHAIVEHGMTNSRMKDYYDLAFLLDRETFDADTLKKAVHSTFKRRGRQLNGTPVGLTDEFATDISRVIVWEGFLRKNELPYTTLPEIILKVRTGLAQLLSFEHTGEEN